MTSEREQLERLLLGRSNTELGAIIFWLVGTSGSAGWAIGSAAGHPHYGTLAGVCVGSVILGIKALWNG